MRFAETFWSKQPTFLINWLTRNRNNEKDRNRVLLIIAHPDDEAMFFVPTIRAFIQAGRSVELLCFTTGNADGLGEIRSGELRRSCEKLGISKITILNEEQDFPDSMVRPWDHGKVSQRILRHLQAEGAFEAILTFDDQGISGHGNHVDLCLGARMAMDKLPDLDLDYYELESVPLVVKYVSVIASLYEAINFTVDSALTGFEKRAGIQNVFSDQILVSHLTWHQYREFVLMAMRQHQSQLVWFRWLYLMFSRYCFVNSLRLRCSDKKHI